MPGARGRAWEFGLVIRFNPRPRLPRLAIRSLAKGAASRFSPSASPGAADSSLRRSGDRAAGAVIRRVSRGADALQHRAALRPTAGLCHARRTSRNRARQHRESRLATIGRIEEDCQDDASRDLTVGLPSRNVRRARSFGRCRAATSTEVSESLHAPGSSRTSDRLGTAAIGDRPAGI